MTRPLILVTNDDGIDSPGLAAAALALDSLGDLLIIAPRTQQSGAGRSMPLHHDGRLFETTVTAQGRTWKAYAAHASPAQAVQHALLELITDRRPKLAVSGINYGENVGTAVTISGTVGAALEAAAHGVPALAVSLQVDRDLHLSNSAQVDFSAAAYFTRFFAGRWLKKPPPPDVDVLKIDVPASATSESRWRITRLEKRPYYIPLPPVRKRLEDEGRIGYTMVYDHASDINTDAGALVHGFVAVTPLSLDMTSRVDFAELARMLNDP